MIIKVFLSDRDKVVQQSYEVQVRMLQSENAKLKDDVELVQNQRSLIDTLRKEIDLLRADQM